MKEVIQQLKPLQAKGDAIDSTWINIWNKEIENKQFCLITFYNIKNHLSKDDLSWCNILVTNALPKAVGENLCSLLKINLAKFNPSNEDVITEMEIYRSISKEYWPEIDKMYEIILQAKENGKFNTHP